MRHNGDNTLRSQDNREELRALPLNWVECAFSLFRRWHWFRLLSDSHEQLGSTVTVVSSHAPPQSHRCVIQRSCCGHCPTGAAPPGMGSTSRHSAPPPDKGAPLGPWLLVPSGPGLWPTHAPPPMAQVQTPMARVGYVLAVLTAGGGMHAAPRPSGVSPKRISRGPERRRGGKQRGGCWRAPTRVCPRAWTAMRGRREARRRRLPTRPKDGQGAAWRAPHGGGGSGTVDARPARCAHQLGLAWAMASSTPGVCPCGLLGNGAREGSVVGALSRCAPAWQARTTATDPAPGRPRTAQAARVATADARSQTAPLSSASSSASRHRAASRHPSHACRSSGSLPDCSATTVCSLPQTHQDGGKAPRSTPRQVRGGWEWASLRPRALYHTASPGGRLRRAGGWLVSP